MIDLTVSDAAALLHVSEKTIYRWIQRKTIPAYKIGGQYRFRRQELLSWAGSRRIVVTPGSLVAPPSTPEASVSLADALNEGGIYYRVAGQGKREVIETATSLLRLPDKVNREYLLQELLAREALHSTAVGEGVAVPHIRTPITPDLPHPLAALCLLENPVDFSALDGRPVTTVVIVLSPSIRAHLRLMAQLSFVLREPKMIEAIERQAGRAEILDIIRETEEHTSPELQQEDPATPVTEV